MLRWGPTYDHSSSQTCVVGSPTCQVRDCCLFFPFYPFYPSIKHLTPFFSQGYSCNSFSISGTSSKTSLLSPSRDKGHFCNFPIVSSSFNSLLISFHTSQSPELQHKRLNVRRSFSIRPCSLLPLLLQLGH